MSITSDLTPGGRKGLSSAFGARWLLGPAFLGRAFLGPAFLGLALLVPVVVLAMHAAMLPQGQWHDEFFTFSFLRSLGFRGALIRMAQWGPRPASEALIFLYWKSVQAAGSPLMAPVLGCAWAILAGLVLAAARPRFGVGRGGRWALALGLPALFLLAGKVGELWYWPLGALAYLPALGAAAYATLVLAGPGVRSARDGAALAAVLTLGALSVEMGAFLALLLCPMLVVEAVWRRRGFWLPAMLTVPVAAGGAVLAALLHGRAAQTMEMVLPETFHHAWPSLLAALPHVAAELAGSADDVWEGTGWDGSPGHMAAVLLVRGLVLAGSWAVFCVAWPRPVPRLRLALLVLALGGTALLSVAGAFYQFGLLCCERHDSTRQALYLLMAVAVAGMLPRRAPWFEGLPGVVGPALLAAALLAQAPPRLRALVQEYRLARVQEAATAAMFHSGDAPGDAPLEVILAPPGPLLEGSHIVPGAYSMAANPPWYVQGPMLFFKKTRMVVRQAP